MLDTATMARYYDVIRLLFLFIFYCWDALFGHYAQLQLWPIENCLFVNGNVAGNMVNL